jgi:hypothetical protein
LDLLRQACHPFAPQIDQRVAIAVELLRQGLMRAKPPALQQLRKQRRIDQGDGQIVHHAHLTRADL